MKPSTIYIHEFSTGIQAERTADGGWVSRGFTGDYINKTIDPIPTAVQNAIRNRDFAVAEGASTEDPAILGRVVRGGGEDWSVVAVVTRGRDDKGRSASMYRYFICQGAENLGHILAWLESIRRQTRRIPIFDPFETKYINQPTLYQITDQTQINLQDAKFQPLLAMEAPIIFPVGQPCSPSLIHQLAIDKARQTGQPVAWAYKAEALEQPRGFVVIQPASEKAEQLLVRAIASAPQYTAPIAGEYDIKSAIKGLISRDTVKPEQVQAIETALGQSVQERDWEVIFNGQGATQARTQGIYSPQMVRLMTLRAIVIPSSLQEFLEWMQKRGKQEDHKEVSQLFQQQINSSRSQIPGDTPKLIGKVSEGVKLIIPRLLEYPELLNSLVWLLGSSQGLWQQVYFHQVAKEIEQEFKSIQTNKNGSQNIRPTKTDDNEWAIILHDLQPCLTHKNTSNSYNNPQQYLPLAKLFSQIESAQFESRKIGAIFYHVSLGKIPEEAFRKLISKQGVHAEVYGIFVTKEMSLIEFIWSQLTRLGDVIMPVPYAIIFMILSFILGILSTNVYIDISKEGKKDVANNAPPNTPSPSSSGASSLNQGLFLPKESSLYPPSANLSSAPSPQVSPDYPKGIEKIDATIEALDKIITESTTSLNKSELEIIRSLESVLQIAPSTYQAARAGERQKQIDLVEAISRYQDIAFKYPLGYVNTTTVETIKKLKIDIKNPPTTFPANNPS